jgi:signal transduction histidine kinase
VAPPRALTLAPEPAPAQLHELEAAFDRFDDRPEMAASLAAASDRARALEAASTGDDARRIAAHAFAADALTALALDCLAEPPLLHATAGLVARILGSSAEAMSLELFVNSISSPRLLELPPSQAIDAQLRLLLALAPLSEVSLWTDGTDRQLRCIASAGEPARTRRVREIARSVLDGASDGAGSDRSALHAVPVLRWQHPHAALVARTGVARERTIAFLQQAARWLGPMLEREILLEQSAEAERTLTEAGERRFLRLGFDLHDGPLQDLVVLGVDLELARHEIGERVGMRARRLVSGRLDDLSAQVEALEASLRELARSLQPTSVVERPLAEVLRDEVEKFEARGGTRAMLELGGGLDGLTDSQRILLFRFVQESLSNVRDHSEASEVQITVEGRPDRIEARVADNGQGFEVEPTLIRAAQKGRLGLLGIGERVRLLGGHFDIRSTPGGPTTLTVSLSRWRPPGDPKR